MKKKKTSEQKQGEEKRERQPVGKRRADQLGSKRE
jgi:hypothetical protein